MALVFGIIGTFLTAIVAIHSARGDGLARKYWLMLAGAAISTMIATVWNAAEQQAFEKQVLGGDSYVYVTFEPLNDTSSKFALHHGGEKYPVYDVNIDLFDMRKAVGVISSDPRVWGQFSQTFQRSVFGEETTVSWVNQFQPTDCYGAWAAITYQRNRPVMSVVSALKQNGKWETATRVMTLEPVPKLLKEQTSSGWKPATAQPTVDVQGAGNFHFTVPTATC